MGEGNLTLEFIMIIILLAGMIDKLQTNMLQSGGNDKAIHPNQGAHRLTVLGTVICIPAGTSNSLPLKTQNVSASFLRTLPQGELVCITNS